MPSGASEHGGPVYDARIQPYTDAAQQAFDYEHIEQAIDLHLFEHKRAAAEVYSHVYDPIPNPTAIAIMGLASERDLIVQLQSRQWEYPFPGAELGPLPPVNRAPDTAPVIGSTDHHRFHAHHIESKRASRRRFA